MKYFLVTFIMMISPLAGINSLVMASETSRSPVLMVAGQSREEFRDYVEKISVKGEACPLPAGASFYTSLDLTGFESPHANEPGDNHQDLEYLKMTLDPLVIQIGLWLSAEQLEGIAAGEYEAQIRELFQALDGLKRPVFLRIGYEFDGPHNRYRPEAYVKAYREIAKVMRGNRDILLTWHSFAMLPTYEHIPVEEWYPGDDLVDWIGISFFQVGTEGYHHAPNRDKLIAMARTKNKPVLVAEASFVRYTRRQRALTGQEWREFWFEPFFEMIESTPEIRAVSIINVDWDSQNQHRFLNWGDSRLDTDPVILERWRKKASEAYWMAADSSLYETIRTISLSSGIESTIPVKHTQQP